jgi:hypothetical protein
MARGVLRTHCRICDGHVDSVGPLSARGKCGTCGDRRLVENHRDLVAHSGPWFDYWRARTLASFGVVAVDAGRDAA